jgi:hypothetical protein
MQMPAAASSGEEVDQIELDDIYHNTEDMECMSVIEHEIGYLTKLAKTTQDPDERSYYSNKVDDLKFKKDNIENNIQIQILTPESYVEGIRKYKVAN